MMVALWVSIAILVFVPLSGFLFRRFPVPPALVPEVEEKSEVVLPSVSKSAVREARIVRELDFLPLVEILSGADMELKRGAIEQLARLKTPEAVHALLDHRSDASLEIRYYINSALARIKKEFDEDLDAARHQMQLDIYKVSARVFLAKIYLQYARSELLDAGLTRSYEEEAIFHLTFVVDSKTPTEESFELLTRCLVQRREWKKAMAVVQRAEEVRQMQSSELACYRVEIAYHQRQFDQIPAELHVIAQNNRLTPEWQTAVLWWGGGS